MYFILLLKYYNNIIFNSKQLIVDRYSLLHCLSVLLNVDHSVKTMQIANISLFIYYYYIIYISKIFSLTF